MVNTASLLVQQMDSFEENDVFGFVIMQRLVNS